MGKKEYLDVFKCQLNINVDKQTGLKADSKKQILIAE